MLELCRIPEFRCIGSAGPSRERKRQLVSKLIETDSQHAFLEIDNANHSLFGELEIVFLVSEILPLKVRNMGFESVTPAVDMDQQISAVAIEQDLIGDVGKLPSRLSDQIVERHLPNEIEVPCRRRTIECTWAAVLRQHIE